MSYKCFRYMNKLCHHMCPHFCIMMVFLCFCVIILHVNRCYNEKALKPKSLCQEECEKAVNDITISNIFFGGGGVEKSH